MVPAFCRPLFSGLAIAALLGAQSAPGHHHPAAGTAATELMEGLGTYHHPIATAVPLAQRYFDQGLTLLYGFNHDEAARLFARAAELDPKSPMPHWGIALALGPNYNQPPEPDREARAWQAIAHALELAPGAPAPERAYIETLSTRYSKDPAADRAELGRKYAAAMGRLAARYPDDLDAATLYAEARMNLRPWQLWNAAGEPAEGTLEICAILEGVLRRNPDHPGANHYYIHAVEASKNPERALESARRLRTLVPGAGHLVHMPSHIYIRTGEYAEAAAINETAAEVDRKYVVRSGVRGMYPLSYYSHNLHFVSYSRMMQGRYSDARDYARQLRANVAGAVDAMPMLAPYGAFEWLVLARFGKWQEMLAEPVPEAKAPLLRALFHYARGAAAAGLGRSSEAREERAHLADLDASIPEDAVAMINPMRLLTAIAKADLDARIARAAGNTADEIAHWRQAVALEDKLAYMEPPEWHYPLREALGGALLRGGQAAAAETVFREDLARHPRNGRSLFGLLQALRAQKKQDSVPWIEQELAAAWAQAQVELRPGDL